MSQILTLTDISYCYPGAPEPLFEHLSATFAAGWAAVLGDNGIGKTTLAKLACGMLSPDSGTVSPNPCKMAVAYCPQRTDETPRNLDDFAADWTGETIAIRDALNIGDDWAYRYETLSGGEAKRLQIACALAGDPDVLVLDEPTNHVDGRTRQAITQAMRRFDGIGIVISHDVELIDATCSRCVMLERRHARGRNITAANTYQGGYTQAAQQMRDNQRADTAAIQSTRKELQRMQRIKRERAQRARELDMRKNQGMRIDIKDIDARKALKNLKPAIGTTVAQTSAQFDGRIAAATDRLAHLSEAAKRYDGTIWMNVMPSSRRELTRIPNDHAIADQPDMLSIGPRDRIGISGPNGSGKTALIRRLIEALERDEAQRHSERMPYLYIPQNSSDMDTANAMNRLHALTDEQRAIVLSAYAQLNADPDRLLAGGNPSPGELRKLLLCLGMIEQPQLIIMDEPTNHLDLHSKQALANTLSSYAGALVAVSHDEWFLNAVTSIRWRCAS